MKNLLSLLLLIFSSAAFAQPVVNAGNDSTLTISPLGTNWNQTGTDTTYLVARSVTNATGTIAYTWTKVSGPAGQTILYPNEPSTPVVGLVPGTYVFRLTVIADNGTTSDDVQHSVITCATTSQTITPGGDGGSILVIPPSSFPHPGHTFFISESNSQFGYIYVEMKGAPGCPYRFKNQGQVIMPNGFDVSKSQWVQIDGSGAGATRTRPDGVKTGISVIGKFKENVNGTIQTYAGGGPIGVSIHESSFIEVNNVEVYKTKYGIVPKDDDVLDTTKNYPNAWQYGHVIRDCWLHYTENQGVYNGNTAGENKRTQDRPRFDPVLQQNVFYNPPRGGFHTYYNLWIDSTGRPGLQPSLQEVGITRITKSHIWYSGLQTDLGQGANIASGMHSRLIVDSNDLRYALTFNVQTTGAKDLYAYRNQMRYGGYAAHHSRWIYQDPGNTQSPVVGTLPDTSFVVAYGGAMHFRADSTSAPEIDQQVWAVGNTTSDSRIMDINDVNRSVVALYTAQGGNNAHPAENFQQHRWSANNRITGNSYNGTPFGLEAPYVYLATTIPAQNVATPMIPIVTANVDQKIKRTWTLLDGTTAGLDGKNIVSNQWSQVSGPSTATFSTGSNQQSFVHGLQNGRYVFRLTAIDSGEVSMTDDVVIDVIGAGSAPVVPYAPKLLRLPRGGRIRKI